MNYKIIMAFIAGLAAGSGVTFVVGRKYLKDHYDICDSDEIVDDEGLQDASESAHKPQEEILSESANITTPHASKASFEAYERNIQRLDYNKMYQGTLEESKKSSNDNDDVGRVYGEEPNKPYVISEEVYIRDDGDEAFDKAEMHYYDDSGVLTDTDDYPMDEEDLQWRIGRNIIDAFADSDDQEIYVRSPKYHIDYDIIRC